jgi:uncharacterized membrane protein YfcA
MEAPFLGIPGIDGWTFIGLAAASLCTAFFGMLTGAGGGPILLGLMAMVMPPAVLIPVHTVVQLGVGASRVLFLWRYILRPTVLPFLAGSLIGVAMGAPIFVNLPTAVLQAIIGGFILTVAWMPEVGRIGPEKARFVLLGIVSAFLGMFVSSAGSFLMSMVHIIKLVAFGIMGFAIGAYLPLMAAMVTTAAAGNWLGRHVLTKIPERAFRGILKGLLTVLALRLLWVAAKGGGLI